jgi:serine/threonine protein kinase
MTDHLGPYELRGELGRGAMAVVWRAYDPKLEREVAIKEPVIGHGTTPPVAEELVARFVREGKAAAKLNHPGIVTIHAADVFDGRPAIVMELIDGETLSAVLDRGPLEIESAMAVLDQLLDAVAYAHERGVVHRDIKPDNVFVTRDGRVKLADFGIAHVGESSTLKTQAGTVMGTPGYMAPEQVTGDPVDARTDVFAIGAIAHEMLGGRNPFGATDGATPTTIMYRIVHEQSAPLPTDIATPLSNAVRRALAKDPRRRYQSAVEFRVALRGTAASRTGTKSLRPTAANKRRGPVGRSARTKTRSRAKPRLSTGSRRPDWRLLGWGAGSIGLVILGVFMVGNLVNATLLTSWFAVLPAQGIGMALTAAALWRRDTPRKSASAWLVLVPWIADLGLLGFMAITYGMSSLPLSAMVIGSGGLLLLLVGMFLPRTKPRPRHVRLAGEAVLLTTIVIMAVMQAPTLGDVWRSHLLQADNEPLTSSHPETGPVLPIQPTDPLAKELIAVVGEYPAWGENATLVGGYVQGATAMAIMRTTGGQDLKMDFFRRFYEWNPDGGDLSRADIWKDTSGPMDVTFYTTELRTTFNSSAREYLKSGKWVWRTPPTPQATAP